jgi:hypothetical protein
MRDNRRVKSDPGRRLLDTGHSGDTGGADPALVAALASYEADPVAGDVDALAALARARLLVPVVAVLGEVEVDELGLARDKSSDMAAVLLTGADGRLALLAFTGLDALRRWDPQARPVPVAAELAARAAVQDDAAALVVDVAGPVTYVVEGEDLHGLAAGWTVTRVGGRAAWIGRAPE